MKKSSIIIFGIILLLLVGCMIYFSDAESITISEEDYDNINGYKNNTGSISVKFYMEQQEEDFVSQINNNEKKKQ